MLERWVEVLGGDEIDLSATEIADACWMAMIQQRFGVERPQRGLTDQTGTTSLPASTATSSPSVAAPEEPLTNDESERTPPPSTGSGTGELVTRRSASDTRSETKTLRVPTESALRDSLPFAQALRPLMQQRAIGQGVQLDEAATVNKIAEERVWQPVAKPRTENWLDLAIVVDESASMLIWRRTIQEITRFFKHYGVFRDVRLWGLTAQDVSQKETGQPSDEEPQAVDPSSEAAASTARQQLYIRSTPFSSIRSQDLRRPDSLLDPSGRRLVLMVTDCVNPLWQTPELLNVLKLWGSSSPMAIMQMMPEWLWRRTYLRQAMLVSLQGKTAGSVNQALEVVLPEVTYQRKSKVDKQADIKVPIVTLEADRLQAWTRMLAAQGGHFAPGLIFNPRAQAATVAVEQRRQQKSSDEETLALSAQAFRGVASPLARRLASLLAASPAITLPVIRIVQEMLLPQSEQIHVAEVLLGGILKPQATVTPDSHPDHVTYQFVEPDIRADLLAEAPVTDTTAVLSRYIKDNFQQSLHDFIVELRRRLSQSDQAAKDELKPIATIAADVLQYRGREYADFVREVRERYDETSLENEPTELDELSPERFPPLADFEFNEGEYVDGDERPTFPPPTRSYPFTVLTLEPALEESPSLETFDITVATLSGSGQQWQVERQQQTARRYVEPLSEEINLEMVAIPGGSFVMGSPDNEPERFDREGPQHEVTIKPFFMGRYPVTQAQWRAVFAMPQVERKLEANPSRFKGENRPVEQVSWYDAVEFCQRLSRYTDREYRLPTEAEWEYACRAGTATPFHFGDMITTEVANYNGRPYAGGPGGEKRSKTTPVDEFGFANAFGLSDMHGNVREWCQDQLHDSYDGAPTDGSAWEDLGERSRRVLRGGSWYLRSEVLPLRLPQLLYARLPQLHYRFSCSMFCAQDSFVALYPLVLQALPGNLALLPFADR